MKQFSELFEQLDRTTSTKAKVGALVRYFENAAAADAAWAVYFMSGRRVKRLLGRVQLIQWLVEASQMDEWIVTECYTAVGDLAETVSLLVANRVESNELERLPLNRWMSENILPLKTFDDEAQGQRVRYWWKNLPSNSCFLMTKLLTGALRVGVSKTIVAKALSEFANLPRAVILHRLMGEWEPSAEFFRSLLDPNTQSEDISKPYPFYLASPLDKAVEELGSPKTWLAEWKWDGIRAQVIRRNQQTFIWSRGEELMSHRFPEITAAAEQLPDGTVLDGEILAWQAHVSPFGELQRRLGRKTVSKKTLAEVPVRYLSYDCLEYLSQDIRQHPMHMRRQRLQTIIQALPTDVIGISELVQASDWHALAQARDQARLQQVEGLMLKHIDSNYGSGRQKGAWWKWKVDPLTIDAVMIYAQAGHGRRATLFTDYTFGVWQDNHLLPIAKAYSGLNNSEINKLDHWIRSNTVERFGPVRAVKPEHVFELAFEGISISSRHKSGIALRFPRIARWRTDMRADEANTLTQVKELLDVYRVC